MDAEDTTRRRLVDALTRSGGNRVRAAELLGIGRATLYRWIERYGLESDVPSRIAQRYEVLRRLGEGDQADVFLVADLAAGRTERALKRLKAAPDAVAQARLRAEFRTLAALRDPGLVRVHDIGDDPETGRPYLVLDVVEGRPFAAAAIGRDAAWILARFCEALRAVDALHRHGLVHRDLKSENVLVGPRGATVMDLGLAESLADVAQRPGGSLLYLAPEVAAGGRASTRSDLYALGVMLYLALAGRYPFQGATPAETIAAQRAGASGPVSTGRSDVPAAVDRLLARLLSADPAARPPDAAAALEDLGPWASPSPRDAPRSLVGRGAELSALLARLSTAGYGPPMTVLVGEAGIGKTRLLESALDELRARGIRVARAECRSGAGRALAPVAEILAQALRGADGSGGTLEDRLVREHGAILDAVTLGTGLERRAALDGCAALLATVARALPLVVGVDDLQLADPFVVDLLEALSRRSSADVPLRLAATARPVDDGPLAAALRAGTAEGLVAVEALGPLGEDGIRALAAETIGPARAAVLAEPLARVTGGNPLYAGAVLAAVVEHGDDALRVPETAQGAVRALLERTDARERAVLEAIAVAGRPATAAEVDRVLATPGDDVAARASALVGRRLLAGTGDGRLDAASAMLRDAVLAELDANARRGYHRAWAEVATDEVDRAAHVLAAGDVDRALFLAAAARLERSWQHAAALELLDAVRRACADDDPGLPDLLARMERGAKAARDLRLGKDVCRAWAALAERRGDVCVESRALALLAVRFRDEGDFAEARATAERALALAESTANGPAIAFAEKVLSSVLWLSWEHTDALAHFERMFERCRASGDLRGAADGLFDLVLVRALGGRVQAGLDASVEAVGRYHDLGELVLEQFVRSNRALALAYLGDLPGAVETLRDALRRIGEIAGDIPVEEIHENLVYTLIRMGRYTEALAAADELLASGLRHGRHRFRVSALLARGEALSQLDDREGARDHDRLAFEIAQALGETAQEVYARIARARDLRVDRRLDASEVEAETAHATAARRRALRARAIAAIERSRTALEREDVGAAHRWLDDAETALAVPREDGPALRAQLLYERARARRLEGSLPLALADVEEAIGLARRAGPVETEIRLYALAAGIHDARGAGDVANEALSRAARRCRSVAEQQSDPTRRARYLARPDIAAIVDAARRRGAGAAVAAPERDASLASLYEVGRALADGGDRAPLLERIVELAVERAGAERGLLLLFDEAVGELRPRAARGIEAETERDAVRLSRSVLAEAERGVPVLAADVQLHPDLAQAASVALFGIRSVMCVPLRAGDEVLGTLYVDTRAANAFFTEADLRFLEALADQAAVALGYTRLLERLARERNAFRSTAVEAHGFGQLVGRSPAIRRVFALLEKVAPTDLSVIVRGASGTGKELAARALHFNSPRRERPFLSENCAALPEPLLESLLFGHVRGAFTGADRDRDGLFVQADGGTLFLDEIGDMGAALQAKLLRALQEREVRPLGGDHAVRVDVRIVAATHRDLPALVAAGTFRHDLYFRLNGITIDLPSLAERREDVPLLFRHFVARECARAGRDAPETAPSLLRALAAHDWPGNVRELENLARRAVLFAEGDVIDGRALQFDPTIAALLARTGPRPRGPRAGDSGAAIDVRRALEASNGDPRGAAALLGVSRATLYRRMQQLGIVRR